MNPSDENIQMPPNGIPDIKLKHGDYWAQVNEFAGPLDILLHFIKVEELNIYDIPISKITKDFLKYIQYMQSLDIEFAGEFLVIAAELMKIKARMLLPEQNEEGEIIEEDPRLTLVQKLLEYKRFKEIAEEFALLENEAKKRFHRTDFDNDPKTFTTDFENDPSLKNITVLNLIKAYKTVISSVRKEVVHPIKLLDITSEDQREYVLNSLKEKNEIDFIEMMGTMKEKLMVICTFLAILQLALEGLIEIIIRNNNKKDFYLRLRAASAGESNGEADV
jgi:segregation and condensation protein A